MMHDLPYHIPALLSETLEGLQIRPDGVYVDLTFGGGGHSCAILGMLNGGRLLAFDQDSDVLEHVPEDSRFTFVQQNFRYLSRMLRFYGVGEVDGVLADLGVSFHQFDVPERGFSTRFDGPLDMRMSTAAGQTARDVVMSYDVEQLTGLFRRYGELPRAHRIAEHLVHVRDSVSLRTTAELLQALEPVWPKERKASQKYAAQVFQALRIEVNKELEALEEMLLQLPEVVKKGGRVAVISYHSLEDRLVKHFFKTGNLEGVEDKDLYGRVSRPFKPVQTRPVVPSEEEVRENPRARSAKLRIAERI